MPAINLTKEFIIIVINDCDKRLAKIKVEKDFLEYQQVIKKQLFNLVSNEEKKEYEQTPKELNNILILTNAASLVRTERMCFNSLLNQANLDIYPRLLAKYDELMVTGYELAKDAVLLGVVQETDYVNLCRKSLGQREFIKVVCESVKIVLKD
jgi:hypothetical protein